MPLTAKTAFLCAELRTNEDQLLCLVEELTDPRTIHALRACVLQFREIRHRFIATNCKLEEFQATYNHPFDQEREF